jgi:hypothetical protein
MPHQGENLCLLNGLISVAPCEKGSIIGGHESFHPTNSPSRETGVRRIQNCGQVAAYIGRSSDMKETTTKPKLVDCLKRAASELRTEAPS